MPQSLSLRYELRNVKAGYKGYKAIVFSFSEKVVEFKTLPRLSKGTSSAQENSGKCNYVIDRKVNKRRRACRDLHSQSAIDIPTTYHCWYLMTKLWQQGIELSNKPFPLNIFHILAALGMA
ncbi:hypothetical protein ACTXT7_004520 [Hymenolepis weldensis]